MNINSSLMNINSELLAHHLLTAK